MNTLSTNTTQNTTTKYHKVYRTRPVIARKVIAFQELINLERKRKSAREAADILEVPNSTMQSWKKRSSLEGDSPELTKFLSTPAGTDFLQRNIIAVMKLMKCGPSGIRGMQEYLYNSGLDKFVASSEGALQNFWVRCENCIVEFGKLEEKRLSTGMQHRKITAALDEMFRGKRPCLVAMDVVSNYILLEKFTEDRTANTWKQELEPRLNELNVGLDQVVSDLCGGIRSAAKGLGAEHIAELFHAQHEISKATSAPLASQEKNSEKALNEAEENIKKISEKPLKLGKNDSKKQRIEKQNKIEEAINIRDNLKVEFTKKSKRRGDVKAAIREMGQIHHPIDLKSGVLQTAEGMKERFNEQFKIIHERAAEANLPESSISRIEKAQRAFDAIVSTLQN